MGESELDSASSVHGTYSVPVMEVWSATNRYLRICRQETRVTRYILLNIVSRVL